MTCISSISQGKHLDWGLISEPINKVKNAFVLIFNKIFDPHKFKKLERTEGIKTLKYAAITEMGFAGKVEWIKPFDLTSYDCKTINGMDLSKISPTLENKGNCFFDQTSGFKATLVEDKDHNRFFVTFGAMGSGASEVSKKADQLKFKQLMSIIKNIFFRKCPSYYEQADKFIGELKNHPTFKDKNIEVCGLSLGASIAQYAALKHQLNAYCFNSVGLGAGLQKKFTKEALENAPNHITHISTIRDLTSDFYGSGTIRRICDLFKVSASKNFGKRVYINSAYKSIRKTHSFFFGSLSKHLGFEKRTKPAEMDDLPKQSLDMV